MDMTQPRRQWTDEEVVKLMNMAQKFPPAQIASEIGRAVASVHTKARQLAISLRMDRLQPRKRKRSIPETRA
jgi:hypothetical protein